MSTGSRSFTSSPPKTEGDDGAGGSGHESDGGALREDAAHHHVLAHVGVSRLEGDEPGAENGSGDAGAHEHERVASSFALRQDISSAVDIARRSRLSL